VERLRSERNQLAAKLNGLRQRSLRGDSVAGQEIEPTQQALAAVAERLQQREHDLERLVIAAPRAGVVLAPSAGPSPTADATHLPTWSGQPLEPRNVGAYLAAGVLVCQVADLDQWEAVLAVDQSQVAFLRPGQPVRLCLDSSPSRAIQSRIEQIAVCAHPADSRGPAAARRERENPPTDRRHPPLTLTALYQASCPFEDTSDQSLSGVQGRARVFTGYQTLGQRLGRWLLTTWR
jgi:putative peptide zinc metalloprotease protein